MSADNVIDIAGIKIGQGYKPFIIAEMSGNHNQSMDKAMEIIDAVSESGADAIKFQTYTADTMTLKGLHTIDEQNELWGGYDLYDLYEEAHTPWEWHKPLFDHAISKGLIPFSSPFDETAVDFLETLNVPLYKIASFENTDWPLIRKVASTGKPIIMSTGVASKEEIQDSLQVLKDAGAKEIILLKCTSTYPAEPTDSNILSIPDMRSTYGTPIGLSDHTMGIGVGIASVAFGAVVIEKHVTISRAEGGVDAAFSMEPHELKALVEETERAFKSIGQVVYGPGDKEKKNSFFKRSLYVTEDVAEGEMFTAENLKVLRPAQGLPPKYFEQLIGQQAPVGFKRGHALQQEDVEELIK